MATRDDLQRWLIETLEELGGSAHIIDVSKTLWANHQEDLHESGDLFYTWQYDLRWEAKKLRNKGVLEPASSARGRSPWTLTNRP